MPAAAPAARSRHPQIGEYMKSNEHILAGVFCDAASASDVTYRICFRIRDDAVFALAIELRIVGEKRTVSLEEQLAQACPAGLAMMYAREIAITALSRFRSRRAPLERGRA